MAMESHRRDAENKSDIDPKISALVRTKHDISALRGEIGPFLRGPLEARSHTEALGGVERLPVQLQVLHTAGEAVC